MRLLRYSAWLAVALVLPLRAEPVKTEHVEAELIAENQSLIRGGDNTLALRLVPEKGWHVYWRNPGDSGLPTKLKWTLPDGVSVGELQWPYPHRETLGSIVNYGYAEETLHLIPLQVADTVSASPMLELKAKASWLVCKDICIPGAAELGLGLPLADKDAMPQPDPRWREAFAKARSELPQPAPADWKALFAARDGDFSLGLGGTRFSESADFEFFPYANDLVNHSAAARLIAHDGALRLSQKLSDSFVKAPQQVDGVLVVRDANVVKAWEIHAQPGVVQPVPVGAGRSNPALAASTPPQGKTGLAAVLLFAVLGGLILNLMPCVFPVLSIKAVSLIESRGAVARRQRAHALAYTFGVLLAFTSLAAALLGLRASGAAIGWGFQLQQPAFVAGLAYLFFGMGLSLSGVAQFGTQLMGLGQSLAAKEGTRGSFFTGVLAVVVASPCTAPFMGTALGYALSQPAYVALAVFLALGMGLALPFLLLGFFPRLGRFLPKPGAWMEVFKQAMAFPLYLSCVWLVWVLGGLTDRNGMAVALIGLTLLGFALWLWNRPGTSARVLKFAALAGALALLASAPLRVPAITSTTLAAERNAAAHEPFSEERVNELRAQGRTVFVDFTADWCITCKVNERVALDTDAVREAFAAQDVAWLVGDWTRSDPVITRVLSRYGRSGVPLYLLYVKGGEAKVLPQILTPEIVVDALKPAS